MIKVLERGPAPEVKKEIVCKSCGARLEYTPNDVVELSLGYVMGDLDIALGFKCPVPECGKSVVTESW